MIKRFLAGSALVQAFKPNPEPIVGSGWSKATTPEELMVAHILHEFAKNPDKWKMHGTPPKRPLKEAEEEASFSVKTPAEYRRGDRTTWYSTPNYDFRMSDGMTIVRSVTQVRNKDGDGIAPWIMRVGVQLHAHGFDDPPITLPHDLAQRLMMTINTIIDQRKEAERVAAQAKQEMEDNERKWNLAEHLLGMRRNEFGALVPKE